MEIVSEEYIEQIKRPIRRACHLRVNMGLVNPDAPALSVLTDNTHSYFSDLESIENPVRPTGQYGTLEDYFFVLDDSQEIPREVEDEQLYQGYCSEFISDENGVFGEDNEPIITISYSEVAKMMGLTLLFDKFAKEYPTEIEMKTYLGDEIVETLTISPTSYNYVYNHSFEYHDKATMRFVSMSRGHRRLRFMEMIYGIIMSYDTSDYSNTNNIVSAIEEKRISMVNKVLPEYTFDFSINNTSRDFDTDNPTGFNNYMTERQPVSYDWGYTLDDGNIEWIRGGEMLTTGSIKSDRQKVTISCTDKITLLNKTYKRGLYRPEGISLYDLAEEVLEYAELGTDSAGDPMYVLDDSLQDISTKANLPKLPIKECLQIIATAGCCTLTSDRDGKINIKKMSEAQEDYYIDLDMFLESSATTEFVAFLKTAISEYYGYTVSTSLSEIATLETKLEETGEQDFVIEYSDSTDIIATVTGATLVSATYYTGACELKISATADSEFKITVKGKEIKKTTTTVEEGFNLTGEIGKFSNPLITNYDSCMNMINFVAGIIENRNKYEGRFVGDPRIDVGDLLKTQTDFTEEMPSSVTHTKIDYAGSFNGNIGFVKKDN